MSRGGRRYGNKPIVATRLSRLLIAIFAGLSTPISSDTIMLASNERAGARAFWSGDWV